jgi:uncharacterized phiE125 gp8 family phage protein
MSFSLVTPPVIEPIALDQAKARLRISDASQDTHIIHLIRVARERIEALTGRVLLAQTWLERRDAFDADGRLLAFGTQFKILKPPLISIDTITIFDADDASKVWPSTAYFVDSLAEPGRIALRRNEAFPKPGRDVGGIEIQFVCGYGASADDVPPPLIEAVGQLVEAMAASGRRVGLPLSIQSLIAPWRRLSL